jgi:hypothetical protein
MAGRMIDIPAEIGRLEGLTIFELRQEWRRVECKFERRSPPMRLSRDLLVRAIVYRLQERALGGLSGAAVKRLRTAAGGSNATGEGRSRTAASIRPGTLLVREWRGVTHRVVILADGVEWRGRRYESLTLVAREITGAHWSGPRFFGLARRKRASDDASSGEGDHAQA